MKTRSTFSDAELRVMLDHAAAAQPRRANLPLSPVRHDLAAADDFAEVAPPYDLGRPRKEATICFLGMAIASVLGLVGSAIVFLLWGRI